MNLHEFMNLISTYYTIMTLSNFSMISGILARNRQGFCPPKF